MPYRLMLKTRPKTTNRRNPRKVLIPLSIEQSREFKRFGFKGSGYGFREIDFFTARFETLDELIVHLKQCGILPTFCPNDELVIVWTGEKSGFREKHHSLFFMDKADYISDPLGKLEKYMNGRAIQEDYNFFTDLINQVYELSLTAGQEYAIEQFQSDLETAYREFGPKFLVMDYGKSPSMIKTFLTTLVTKTSPNNDISNPQNQELNWWMVHHLIDFVTDYENKHNSRKQTDFTRVKAPPKNKNV